MINLSTRERHITIDDLLTAIRAGHVHARSIGAHLDVHFRVVDRALQRARRKGLIKYLSPVQGWTVEESDDEPKGVHITLQEAIALRAAVIGDRFDVKVMDSAIRKIDAAERAADSGSTGGGS